MMSDVGRLPGSQVSAEVRVRHADGSWLVIEAVAKNLLHDPAVGGIVINYRDVTARKSLEDELKRQAFHDSLTGLANRALFADRLQHAISRAERSPNALAVLFVDLDDFKTVNDSLGHGEGDLLLVAVADRLRARSGPATRSPGWAATSSPSSSRTRSTARRRWMSAGGCSPSSSRPSSTAGRSCSSGPASGSPRRGSRDHTADEVLRNADVAMYTAKTNGKNRLEVFEPGMHAAALTRLALKGDLERALERGEFSLVYQPIVRLAGGRLSGVEALLRWQHPRAWDGRADRIHPGRGGDRRDPAARPLGPRAGLRAGRGVERDLAPADHDERERVRATAPASGLRRGGRRGPRVDRPRAAAPHPRAHRERPDAGRRGRDRGARAS